MRYDERQKYIESKKIGSNGEWTYLIYRICNKCGSVAIGTFEIMYELK